MRLKYSYKNWPLLHAIIVAANSWVIASTRVCPLNLVTLVCLPAVTPLTVP